VPAVVSLSLDTRRAWADNDGMAITPNTEGRDMQITPNLAARVYSETVNQRVFWFWEVYDANNPTDFDGTPVFYGRSVTTTREDAEHAARERIAGA